MHLRPGYAPHALTALCIAALSACGGSSHNDDPPTPIPPGPTPVVLQGKVIVDQAVRNAVVCLDLNANGVCDAGEPASQRTGADGAYEVRYLPGAVDARQAAGASLIASMVPGDAANANTTIDAAAPGGALATRAYTLRQVPGKAGEINPLTTLVAAGVAGGMSEADARANVAQQLGIAQEKIDGYQNDPATDPARVRDNARTAARAVAAALNDGAKLSVGDQRGASAAQAGELLTLRYAGPGDYYARSVMTPARAPGEAPVFQDVRTIKEGGNAVTDVRALYPAIYLTPTGWQRCDGATLHENARGTPGRSVYCQSQASLGYGVSRDISGQKMATVIQEMRANPASNTINADLDVAPVLAAVGDAVFPAGSSMRMRTGVNVVQPIYIRDTRSDARPQKEATSLEALIAAKPASAVNLATAAGSLSMGVSTSERRNLRVAFTGATGPSSGTVQFYECDLNAAQTLASNCTATQTGTYAIETVNGVRVMRFAGHAPTPASGDENLYAEVKGTSSGDYVFRARQPKADAGRAMSQSQRLNSTAWEALKAKLGL